MSADDRDLNDQLNTLIAELLDAEFRGEPVDRDALVDKHPEHADALREFFAAHDQMRMAAGGDNLPPSPPSREDRAFATTVPTARSKSPVGDRVRYFGEYELLQEIGRGGMGVVYLACQTKLKRIVALKMIRAGHLASEDEVYRFYTEAEAAAKLSHAGIVPIFQIGEYQGQHFFSMGLVKGESLQQKLVSGPFAPLEAAELCRKVADAVAYAHGQGVIHRDLKPGNIMLDSAGNPVVTDFGLAKKIETNSGITRTGAVIGTPSYMPPEQATGGSIDPRADVYSIGAILYTTLTGRPPFQSANVVDTLRQVLERDPVPPRQLDPQIERDVETVCIKCLAKSPSSRYESAKDLADDLARFLNDEPILARPPSLWERSTRWSRQHVVIVTTVMLLLTTSVVLMPLGQLLGRDRQAPPTAPASSESVVTNATSDPARVVREMSRMIVEDPDSAAAHYERGLAQIEQENYGEALDDLSAAIQRDDQKADYSIARGIAWARQERFEEAIKDLNRALELRPDSADAYFERASAHFAIGNLEKSRNDADRAIELRPSFGEAYRLRGKILRRMGEIEQSSRDNATATRLGASANGP